MTDYETILVETRGRVGWITLNRPEALNALNTQTMKDVVAAASAFDRDEGIGAHGLTVHAKADGLDLERMARLLDVQDKVSHGTLAFAIDARLGVSGSPSASACAA